MSYSIVISKADLIVEGSVTKIIKGKYEFTINEYIKGKSTPKIYVTIWDEWTCDRRIEKLKVGQKLILFLEKSKTEYSVINQSTGELFVKKDNTVSTFMLLKFPKAPVLKKGISMFLETYSCYGDLNDRFLQNMYFQKKKSSTEINKMKKENDFFKYLSEEELKYYTVK
ncbi:hypothetical protein LNQ49_00275 [Flavobacterium sp. F-65]|uniref:Uncharacterized protein n=1 Tax=Flavobacterium pisciphilum TaxID=2893755 RepID=A0ABS8MMP1_9FLAO|nr:hypothetical protein [Flavobacterium sp. F-65]MCC9070039.1 hypothetical protein [Flavobacterium sp. F-65]